MRRITLAAALLLAACTPEGSSEDNADEPCDGHGELHDDHCHCDDGYSQPRNDALRCIADEVEPDASADMGAPEPEDTGVGVDATVDDEPDRGGDEPDAAIDGGEPEPALTLDGAEVTARTLLDHDGDRVWLLDARADGHRLRLENYAAFGGPVAPGRVAIEAVDADYASCGLCLVLETDCAAGGACETTWMPVPGSGAVELTALGDGEGEPMSGQLEGLMFREVEIDAETYATTVVPGGSETALSDWAFDVMLDVECSGHGHLHGDTCHCDAGYQNDPNDPGRCVPV